MRLPQEFRRFDRMAYRHTMMDGLTDAALGVFLLLLAAAFSTGPYALLFFVLPVILVFVVRFLQRRYTTPRIGYVEPVADKPREVLPGILLYAAIVIAATLVIAFVTSRRPTGFDHEVMRQNIYNWKPAMAGIMVAGGFWYAGSRAGFRRHFALAAVSAALGAAIVVLAYLPDLVFLSRMGLQIYCAGMGGIVLACGLVTFFRFLHRHPVPPPEATHVQN
jgi:hypothetical protein